MLPTGGSWWNTLTSGRLKVHGESVLYEIDSGAVPQEIVMRNGLEIVICADETCYHGSAEALMAARICERKQIPLGAERPARRSSTYRDRKWRSRRQPDETFLFRQEAEHAHAQRTKGYARYESKTRGIPELAATKPRPSYVRLVVDNTHPTS